MEKLSASPPHVLMPSTGELNDALVPHVGTWSPKLCVLCFGTGQFVGYKPSTFEPVEYECNCEDQLVLQRWMAVRGLNQAWQGLRTVDMTGLAPETGQWFGEFYGAIEDVMRAGFGAVIGGAPGSGKTAISVLIAKHAMEVEPNVNVVFARHFLANAHAWANDKERFARWEARMWASRLLIIDDFGKEGNNAEDAASNTLVERKIEGILRERIDRGLSTILTTNFDHTKLRQKFGDQTMSLLRSHGDMVTVNSKEDWRPHEYERARNEAFHRIRRPAVFW